MLNVDPRIPRNQIEEIDRGPNSERLTISNLIEMIDSKNQELGEKIKLSEWKWSLNFPMDSSDSVLNQIGVYHSFLLPLGALFTSIGVAGETEFLPAGYTFLATATAPWLAFMAKRYWPGSKVSHWKEKSKHLSLLKTELESYPSPEAVRNILLDPIIKHAIMKQFSVEQFKEITGLEKIPFNSTNDLNGEFSIDFILEKMVRMAEDQSKESDMSIPPVSSTNVAIPKTRPQKRRRVRGAQEAPVEQATAAQPACTASPFQGLTSRQIAELLPQLSQAQLPQALARVRIEHLKQMIIAVDTPFKLQAVEAMKEDTVRNNLWKLKLRAILESIPAGHLSEAFARMDQSQKITLVPTYMDLLPFIDFFQSLRFPDDKPVLEVMYHKQLDWGFDCLPPEKLRTYLDILPPLYLESRLADWNPAMTSAQFAITLARSAVFRERIIEAANGLSEIQMKIAVVLFPANEIHDLFDAIYGVEIPARISPLIPLMSCRKVMALTNIYFTKSMIAFMSQKQINAMITTLGEDKLEDALQQMTLPQLSRCLCHIPEYLRASLTLELYWYLKHSPEFKREEMELFRWWQIGIGVTIPSRFSKLKQLFEKLTPFQFETAVRCMSFEQIRESYFDLTEELRKNLLPILLHDRCLLAQEQGYIQLPHLLETRDFLRNELDQVTMDCDSLNQKIDALETESASREAIRELSKQAARLEKNVLELRHLCKTSQESITFYLDIFRMIKIGRPRTEYLAESYESLGAEIYNLVKDLTDHTGTGGLKVRLGRLRARLASETQQPIQSITESLALDSTQLIALYEQTKTTFGLIGIGSNELDEMGLSWEDLVDNGLTSSTMLSRNGIVDMNTCKSFFRSRNRG